MVNKLKILCAAMDSQGHVNAIIGFAKILEERGHQVIITGAIGWKAAIEKHNFEFIPLNLDLPKKKEENKCEKETQIKNEIQVEIKIESNEEKENIETKIETKCENVEIKDDKEKSEKEQKDENGCPKIVSNGTNGVKETDKSPNNMVADAEVKIEVIELKDDQIPKVETNGIETKESESNGKSENNETNETNGSIETNGVKETNGIKETIEIKEPNAVKEKKEIEEIVEINEIKEIKEIKESNGVEEMNCVNEKIKSSETVIDESKPITNEQSIEIKEEIKPDAPNKEMIEIIERSLKDLRLRPIDYVKNYAKNVPIWLGWYNKQFIFDDALQEVMDTVKPDMIVIDFMMRLPCLEKSKIPWAQLWSCGPTMLYNGHCPPATTGYPTDSPRELWDGYMLIWDDSSKPVMDHINKWLVERGVKPYGKKDIVSVAKSEWINFYTYPSILDYTDVAPQPDKWIRMDPVIREPDDPTPFVVPEKLSDKPGKLVYFSLGTMGSVDIELMKRTIDVLAKSPHRFIVSKGPLHDKIDLPDNMWGDKYVNQIAILPHVDLVITHGGNNTLAESLYFAKPMIVMPVFFDQLDNAQRVQEKGIGIRIDTYHYQDSDLLDAIEKVLTDDSLKEKLTSISTELRSSNTKEMVCELIEKTVALGKSPFDVDQPKEMSNGHQVSEQKSDIK